MLEREGLEVDVRRTPLAGDDPCPRDYDGSSVPRVRFRDALVIRLMMHKGGHPTDTTHDHEFTDWDAVEDFAREFALLLAVAR